MIFDLDEVDIKPGIKSDQSMITLSFLIKESQKSFWKFNSALLKDINYINLIKDKITECHDTYANFENKALLWDIIKCEIRTITVSYAAYKAKERRQLWETLSKELSMLEHRLDQGENILLEYNEKKREVEDFNDHITQCIFIRSRAQWVEDSEKCTKYFLQLEKKNYNAKYKNPT